MLTIISNGFLKKYVPLAISFYTFSQISCIVDLYNQDKTYEITLIDYALYIIYYPKLIQGPIVNYNYFISQINDKENYVVNWDNIKKGLFTFILGLSKKVLLADILSKAANWGFSNIDSLDFLNGIVVLLSYTFQIYFDFSGYSDMSVGISKMLNISLIDNFDYPYNSLNISQFWKKWHISLTNFLTKYIYIPLGGNKKGKIRTYVNIIIVFLISGFWHGSGFNYLLWGALNGLLLVLYKIFNKKYDRLNKYVRFFINFFVINFLWLVFRTNSITDLSNFLNKLSIMNFNGFNSKLITCFDFVSLDFVPEEFSFIRVFETSRYYIIIYLAISFILSVKGGKIRKYIIDEKTNTIKMIFLIILFMWCILSISKNTVFIYEGF